MKLAIMQPYFFPYIGYFQLLNAVDKFILYDDVTYIKRGWINRNNILINKNKILITLSLKSVSQNKLINEIEVNTNNNLIKTIKQAYLKAPYFDYAFPIIEKTFESIKPGFKISEISGLSIMNVAEYLKLDTLFEYSSISYSDTKGLGRAQRLIEICKINRADTYINPIGGIELYSKEEFKNENINLFFIKSSIEPYKQFDNDFVPGLSIIDVLMFNSPEQTKEMLNKYKLI